MKLFCLRPMQGPGVDDTYERWVNLDLLLYVDFRRDKKTKRLASITLQFSDSGMGYVLTGMNMVRFLESYRDNQIGYGCHLHYDINQVKGEVMRTEKEIQDSISRLAGSSS